MSSIMAQDKKPRGRPKNETKKTYSVFSRVSDALGTALDRYLGSQRPSPSVASVVEVALEDFLKEKGFWPPQES